jgi:ABC-2 type transport system permease protein
MVPIAGCLLFGGTLILSRLPAMMLLIAYFLVFVHTISFSVACLAFFMNRAHSFVGIKNMAIWVLAGEMIPLDLYPEPFRTILLRSPFASGTYIPVGYITGRISSELFWQSFISITLGILFIGAIARFLWRRGLQNYAGTGA